MSNTNNLSLAHTSWNCKYHVVFAPKYRRKEFYGLKRLQIGQILRKLCEWKGIAIHEAEVCADHVQILISIDFERDPVKGYHAIDAGVGPFRGHLEWQLVAKGLSPRK